MNLAMRSTHLLLPVALLGFACAPPQSSHADGSPIEDAGNPNGQNDAGPAADAGLVGVLAETTRGPSNCVQPPNADGGVSSAVQGNTALAVQLLNQLSSTSSGANVFYSPLSISTAMAMVTEGANGATAAQLTQYLDFPSSGVSLAASYGALACQLEANGEAPDGGQIDLANAVFGQKGDTFEQPFETTLSTDFGAPFTPVDFESNADGVRQEIDAWVSQQTAGMIPQLLGPGSVTPDMKLVLVDALYFNENWPTAFEPAMNGTFNLSATQTAQVPMLTGALMGTGYYADSNVIVAELPFANTKEAIDFVLPASSTVTLAQVEAGLTATQFQGWITGLSKQTVLVTIPKFKIDWSSNLIPAFQALGLTAPFDPNSADFSGIDGAKDLYISLLQHEAVLEVNETGVTAAAATAVGVSGNAAPSWTETFSANQPFLVAIRDVPTGTVLFIGQVTNP